MKLFANMVIGKPRCGIAKTVFGVIEAEDKDTAIQKSREAFERINSGEDADAINVLEVDTELFEHFIVIPKSALPNPHSA